MAPNELCWTCKNACGNCEWSSADENGKLMFEPVPGWKAKKVTLRLYSTHGKPYRVETYHITDCPKYSPDDRKKAVNSIGKKEEKKSASDSGNKGRCGEGKKQGTGRGH